MGEILRAGTLGESAPVGQFCLDTAQPRRGRYLEVTVAHIYTELQRDAGDRCRYSFFKMEVVCMGDTLLAGKYRIRFLFRS